MYDRAMQGGYVFIDAAAGTGKTFTVKVIVASKRAQGKACMCTASSVLAAVLMEAGRTVHCQF